MLLLRWIADGQAVFDESPCPKLQRWAHAKAEDVVSKRPCAREHRISIHGLAGDSVHFLLCRTLAFNLLLRCRTSDVLALS